MTFSQETMSLNIDTKPRHTVFSKLEKLITLMNDQKIGVPLQNKKHLLSTIHSSFSGNDLITWLAERFCGNDKDEAMHLATCLCMYGYIYPTDIRSFIVKDDRSIRYRFQSPCYWPSKHLKLTNEKFIIYLLKRSKRNKQKHGLDEHEQAALNKLQIVFSDKMGFLRTNAEEQVKLVKSMKRDDKALHDLQERAFWRVHRPPPKPKGEDKPPEKVKQREIIRRESQKPWNRASNHVYCGEPKKDAKDENKDEQENDAKQSSNGVTEGSNNGKLPDGTNVNNNNESNGDNKKSRVENGGDVNNSNLALVHKNFWDEMKFSIPSIDKHPAVVDGPLDLYPPPAMAPFDPTSVKIIKRPRSVDAVLDYSNKSVNRSRPLSYSPGLINKTKHPRSLHSIEEVPKFRERPKSIDLSLFFQGDKDNNIQKLKRLLTQKSPRKSKTHPDHYVLDRLILQPNQVKCIEEGPSRCFQPSQMIARKKKNRDFKLKEVEYLRRVIARPRMKFSKSLEILIQRCLQYSEYDPFLDQLAAQPSNPWLSDDQTFWDINKPLVDIPTVTRMKKWSLSFDDLLADETGMTEFEIFLKKEYSHENIRFYRACKELISAPLSRVKSIKASIESEFLTHGAHCEVNIDAKTMELVRGNVNSEKDVNRFMFQPAMEHVYALMKKDSYTRFIRSEEYNILMQGAQSLFTKKRNLFFGGSNKKKNTQSPSPQPRRRGSAGSDNQIPSDTEIGGVSYHSYSTGNLREFDDKPKRAYRESYVGSDSSIYVGTSNSPSLRRRTDTEDSKKIDSDIRRRSNLDVPRPSNYGGNAAQDPNRKSEAMSQCLALAVPGKTNIVTPWDGQQTN